MWIQVKPEDASIYSLAALTAKTGDEFAMFAKNDVKIIIRGASNKPWIVPDDLLRRIFDEKLRWTGHSHPTTVNLEASVEDRETLHKLTWQKKSAVIDLNGDVKEFTPNVAADTWRTN